MTLEEAIAEVKAGGVRNWGGFDTNPEAVATIITAIASGDLIPLSDHRLAVGQVGEGDFHKRALEWAKFRLMTERAEAAEAEVHVLKSAHEDTCAKLNGYITYAAEQHERAEAAEAEVARLYAGKAMQRARAKEAQENRK